MDIFFNPNEQRIRSGWRLFLQLVMMTLLITLGFMGIQFFWSSSLRVATTLPQFTGVLASVWIMARYVDKRPLSDFGIKLNAQWARGFWAGTAIAAIAIGTIFLIEWWAGWLTIAGYGWNSSGTISFWVGMISSLFAMLMVGFHEELFSRGYQLLNFTEAFRSPEIDKRGAVAIAVLITSTLFGFLHMWNPNASAISTFNIVLAGVVLAIPYVVTGQLAISVGLHFSWNFVMAAILGFPVSGMKFETSAVVIEQTGNQLWTGGRFGPEAGLLGLLGMAIMLGLSLVYIQRSGYELATADLFTKEYVPAVESDEQSP